MKPIKLPIFDRILDAPVGHPEVEKLPCVLGSDGAVWTCWSVSFLERMRVLFSGKIYVGVMTYGSGIQPPMTLTVVSPFMDGDSGEKT